MGSPICELPPLPSELRDDDSLIVTYSKEEQDINIYLIKVSLLKDFLIQITLAETATQVNSVDLSIDVN